MNKIDHKRTVGEIAVSYVVWDGEDWATPKQFNVKYGSSPFSNPDPDELLVKDSDKDHWMVKTFISSAILNEREACADLVTGWFNDVPIDEPIDSQLIDLVNELGEAIRERK